MEQVNNTFWGLVLQSGKQYEQIVEKSFHISMAALDISNAAAGSQTQVMITVDGNEYILCHLSKKSPQQTLDLNFQGGDSLVLHINGEAPQPVHLTGFYNEMDDDDDMDDLMRDVSDEEDEEVPDLVPAKLNAQMLKRKKEAAGQPSKKAKLDTSLVDNEAESDDEDDSDDEEDEDKETDGVDDAELEEEEVEEGFSDDEDDDDDDEDDDDEDDSDDDEDDEDESAEEEEKPAKTVPLKKKDTPAKKEVPAPKKETPAKKQPTPQVNGTAGGDASAKKKVKDEPKSPPKSDKKAQQTPKSIKKTLAGGVMIEDLVVGTGAAAARGRPVSVYYVGRLKQNNKQFDATVGGPGFRFKLGAREVIKGWDVGVEGMKVGGKRRITCPPHMAYGARGSPPVIPPNSALVFDVTLKNVH